MRPLASMTYARQPWPSAVVWMLLAAFAVAACGGKKTASDDPAPAEDPVTPPLGGDQPSADDGGDGSTPDVDPPVDEPVKPVKPAVPSATYSVLDVSTATVIAGQTATLRLTAMSAPNKPYTKGGATVVFNRSGGTSNGTIGAVTDHGDGTYTATFTGTTAGTATSVHAMLNGKVVTTPAPSLTVVAGPVSAAHSSLASDVVVVAAGDEATLRVTTRDAHNNAIPVGGASVTFSQVGGTSSGTFSTVTDNSDGTYTATFTGVNAGTATTILADIGGQAVGGAPLAITVLPGGVSLSESIVSTASGSVAAGASSALTLTVYDDQGNQHTSGGLTVAFGHAGGSSVGTIGAVTDNGDGTYSASFTGQTKGSPTTITATINGFAVTSSAPTVVVTPGTPSLAHSHVTVSSAAIAAGATSTLTLTVFDAHGNQRDDGGLTVVFSHSGGTSSGTIGATTDNGDGTYAAMFTGTTKGTATNIHATIDGDPVSTTPPTITVSPGAASLSNSLISVSPNSIASGSVSTMRLTAYDAYNNRIEDGGRTVAFSRVGGGSTGVIGATTDNGDGTYDANFTGQLKGSATSIHATIDGQAVTSAAPTITVTQGPLSLAASSVSVSSGSVVAGNTVNLTLTTRDAAGNQFAVGGRTVVFSLAGGVSAGAIDPVVDNGNGTYSAVLHAEIAGTASNVQATIDGQAVTHAAPTITVTPGAFDLDNSSIATSDDTVISGENAVVTLTARDVFGNRLAGGGLTVTFAYDSGSSTFDVGAVTDHNDGTYSAIFDGVIAGTPVDVVGRINGDDLTSPSISMSVLTGPASPDGSEVSTSASSVASGDAITVTLTAKDVNGNAILNGGLTVTFRHQGGASTGNFSATTDNANGTYTATFTGAVAGSATEIVGTINGVDVSTVLPSVTVTPSSNVGYVFENFDTSVDAGDVINFTVAVRDEFGNVIPDYVGTIHFSSTDAQATLPGDYTFTLGDAGIKAFSVTLKSAGTQQVDAEDLADPTVDGSQAGIEVAALPASKLGFVGPAAAKAGLCSDALAVTVQDIYNNAVPVAADVNLTLSGAGAGAFYADGACETPIPTPIIAASGSSTDVYFKSDVVEDLMLIAQDQAAVLTDANYDFAVEPYQAWIGASHAASWFQSAGDPVRGRLDAQFNVPMGSAFDGNNYFYVVDGTNNRLMKYDATSGNFVGWHGRVGVTPTGGDMGCSTTPANSSTPGWCVGGRPTSGAGNGQFTAPQAILINGTNAYISDGTNNRIVRYNLTTGTFTGWIGKILTSPNGGDAGCAGAAIGSFTPGWCMGGTAATGTTGNGDGHFNAPRAMVTDGTSLYVADASNHRIQRFTLATGAFTGWIGRINASPTGGDPGCAGAATDSTTPGWCTGGTAKTGTGNGHFNTPRGVAVTGGHLYVTDSGNHRIQRWTTAGVFSGWIGRISTSPTGGGAGCAGAAVNSYTPHWCTGGTAKSGSGNGNMSTPYRLITDGTHLVISDYTNQRMTKVALSNGAFSGWIGRVLTSPTGGAPGCAGAPVNSVTPGWCVGGTAAYGASLGMFYNVQGLDGDGTYGYVADSTNHRIQRFSLATGAFSGWTGARAALTTAWSQTSPSQTILSGYGDQQFNALGGAHVVDGMLYVADTSNHRIQRYNTNNGSFAGWIGSIWTPPTGGDAGCNGAVVTNPTPGWCTGGNAKSGTGNGHFNAPQGTYGDATHLFVLDSTNHRIVKYDRAAGTLIGWIGRVSTSPTAGDAGCAGAPANGFTPGWCRGGTAKTGTGDGHLNTPAGITGDATYIYVSDGGNHRVVRYNKSTGAFGGWIGRVLTSPTGGDAGCSGSTVGTYTPGWCTGGTAGTGTADGNFAAPRGIALDATYLYVAAASNHRITRHAISNGAFGGWIGRISTSPTGGAAGCAGAAVNAFTPGWCTGGTAKSGNANGHLNAPRGISVTANGLYVVDVTNNRISKYDQSNGAFLGWSGAIATAPNGGDDGCTTAAIGAMTPGWCQGGTAKAGMGLGMFDVPADVTSDSTYLYVTDVNNARVTRVPQ